MRLAIADPPYPPQFAERRDRPTGPLRLTTRSRALRWYGDGPRAASDSPPADFHPEAGVWDSLDEHRALMERLIGSYDGWAIATTPDGLGAYHPLPVSARVMAWVKPNSLPGGARIINRWEPVIVFPPEGRRHRSQPRVSDVLVAAPLHVDFIGAKPPEWTEWVLKALGFEPGIDEVDDIFPGSGSVSAAVERMHA